MPAKDEKPILLRLRGEDLKIFKELRDYYTNEEQQEVILMALRVLHAGVKEKRAKDKR